MKKIFSLLAALIVLSTSGVWAQEASTTATNVAKVYEDETTATDLTSGYYVMQVSVNSKVGFAYYNGTNPITNSEGQRFAVNTESGQSTQTVAAKDDLSYVWYISKSADNSMLSIQSARTGAFIPVQEVRDGDGGNVYKNMSPPKDLTNAAALYYSDGTINGKKEGVMLYQTNYKYDAKKFVVHVNGWGNTWYMSYWEGGAPTGKTSVCVFKFYKVDLVEGVSTSATLDARPIRFQPQIDGVNVEEDVCAKVLKNGDKITYPLGYSDMLYNAPTLSEATVSSSTGVVTANFTKKASPSIELDTYYKLKVPRRTTLYVTQDGNVQQTYSSKNFIVGYYNPKTFWKFVKDGLKVKMVCGTGKYVKVAMPVSDNNTSKATFVDDATNAVRFSLCDKPSNSGYTGNGGFLLKMESSDKVVLGDHGGSHTLGSWKHTNAFTDGGSCFIIEAQLTPEETHLLIPERLSIDQPSSLNENLLRMATPERIVQAKALLPNDGSSATLQQMINAYNTAFEVRPDANAFYRIKNMNVLTGNHTEAEAKRYPSSEDIAVATNGSLQTAYDNNKGNINRTITRKSVKGNIVAQLWQFVDAGDGSYYIQNANTGCRWANTYSENMDMPTENNSNVAGKFSIVAAPVTGKGNDGKIATQNDGVSTFLITLQGQHVINAYEGLNGNYLKEDASNNTPCNDPGNYWQIEKVTSIPVNITAAKYATVGYPFNVKVTDDKVRVYYAKEATNGVMKLTEATDKIIPANQGAILYYEGEGSTTAKLDIVSENGEGFVDNILTASTAKRIGFDTKTTYGLSNKEGKVSFRLNTDTYVPANKSYLLASKYNSGSGNAQQLLFSFDNVVEGIDNAVVDGQNANKVYYDLQGRRVMYPAHGIFVTENGEKVFIK